MSAPPQDIRPPFFLRSSSRPQPPSLGKTPNTRTPTAPKTHTLQGYFHIDPDRRRNQQNERLIAGRHSHVVIPSALLPATLPSSCTINPTPPHQNILNPSDSAARQTQPNTKPTTQFNPHPQTENQEDEPVVSIIKSKQNQHLGPSPSGPQRSESCASSVSCGSLSDFSRPPFSRSTDLASSRSSGWSADFRDSDPEHSICSSALLSSSAKQGLMPLASYPVEESNLPQSPSNTTTTLPLYEPVFGPTKPLTPLKTSPSVLAQVDKHLSRPESTRPTENLHLEASVDPCTLAFPSTTWSSCPSPQSTSPRSFGSGPELNPSLSSVTRLESHRWSVLPPISSVRGCSGSSSCLSELSVSQSHVFDELEAIAPPSAPCSSMGQASDSCAGPSPDRELSPGLAALTVGCDSGNLGSLSRVKLLLLDRMMSHSEMSPVHNWAGLNVHHHPGPLSQGVPRPCTAGRSERCHSTGKVLQNKSDRSEGGSGSPSSWIIETSPSYDMFRSTSSTCASTGEGGSNEEVSNSFEWRDSMNPSAEGMRPGSVDQTSREKDRQMEERNTKVLDMLSKLQGDTPRRQTTSLKGCSNFEEFDFLAKYCIFSQEKLAEYRRAFEAEDSDGDGYISCLQVLLALKDIIPPDLLSDEEEIYVYRILEMVDFRVTDGLVDLRLFAVIASLAQRIASMDDFMRSLISDMDFRSLEVRLFKAKQLFLFLLEEQRGDCVGQGLISPEQLLLELKAGGILLERGEAVRLELQKIPPLDLIDFLAYLPLFMLIHKSVISNPLDDSSNL